MSEVKPKLKIFISYRQDDNPDFVARIRDWFIHSYGRENVFMDFDSIPRFVPFTEFIREKVKECDVLIAIIGPRWIELMREKSKKFEEDYVRIEIGLALQNRKLVAPICIKNAPIPEKSTLPSELRSILETNIAKLEADSTFYDNIARIMQDVEDALNWRFGAEALARGSSFEKESPRLSKLSDKDINETRKAHSLKAQKIIERVNLSPFPPEASALDKMQAGLKFLSTASIDTLSEVIQLNPRHYEAYNSRGIARKEKGDLDGAITDYSQAIRLKPDYGVAYNNRGNARREKGDLDGAIADYNEAIRLNSENAIAYNNRGIVRADQGDLDGAIADYNEAIRLKLNYARPYSNRAEAYFLLKEFDKATLGFKKAHELDPKDYFPRAGLAITYYTLGNKAEAKQLWQELVEQDARYMDAEWVGKEFSWEEPLVEAARKLIAEL